VQNHLPRAEIIESSSTTRAAELAARDRTSAAIASSLAAERYDLSVIVYNIQDNPRNATRFLVLGRQSPPATGNDRTSLMLSVADKVGALHCAIAPFRRYRVNMTKIESRPSKRKAWEYYFFIDCEGHVSEARMVKAIAQLEEHCSFVKVLGSYPNTD
jgi:chorismate mutase/prephenate dehydratase